MGRKYGVEIKKDQVDLRRLQTTSSANVCNCISRDVDTVCFFFHRARNKTVKEKHCFDRNAGRVPITLQLPQPDSQKVFKSLHQALFWRANLNSFLHLGLGVVHSPNELPGFLSLFFTVMLRQYIVSYSFIQTCFSYKAEKQSLQIIFQLL